MRLNLNVFCFVGGRLDNQLTSRSYPALPQIYLGLGGNRFQGVVVLTGTLGDDIPASHHQALLDSYSMHARCTVGVAVEGFASVTIDNAAGMREALTHLIRETGRTRIAYIGGPEANFEAQERYRVYREVLAESNISYEPELVVYGDFGAASGARAAHTLLTQRHVAFDALMAASDLMAVGAMNVLLERGVAVPSRVSICGFDDIEPARFAAHPLTTVHQPLTDLGKFATEQVLSGIYGTQTQQHVVLPATLVKRRSTEHKKNSVLPQQIVGRGASVSDVFASLMAPLEAAFREQAGKQGGPDNSNALIVSFFRELGSGRQGIIQRTSFLKQLEQHVIAVLGQDGDAAVVYDLLDKLQRSVLSALQTLSENGNTSPREPIERSVSACKSLISSAQASVGITAERFHVQYRLQLREWQDTIHVVSERLLHVNNMAELGRIFSTEVPRLGIPAGILCTFEQEGNVRAHMAFDDFTMVDCPPDLYHSADLFPEGLFDDDQRRTWITTDIHGRDGATGYVSLEMGPLDAEIYQLLAHSLSGALRGIETLAPLPASVSDDEFEEDLEPSYGSERL